jgi:hypothetical protein
MAVRADHTIKDPRLKSMDPLFLVAAASHYCWLLVELFPDEHKRKETITILYQVVK